MDFPRVACGQTPAQLSLSLSPVSSLDTFLTCANIQVDVIKLDLVGQLVSPATYGVQGCHRYPHKNCLWRHVHVVGEQETEN